MRIQKIICDKCKGEIDVNPYKFCVEEADRTSGDFITSYDKYNDLASYDFCAKCVENIEMMIRNVCMPVPNPIKAKSADTKTVDSTEEKKKQVTKVKNMIMTQFGIYINRACVISI